jgi:3-dehydroquinate synthase
MRTVRINLGPRSYDIAFNTGNNRGFGAFARSALPIAKRALFVTDANTQAHGRELEKALRETGFQTGFVIVPAGEESKSISELSRLYDALYELAADRNSCVVAVGGGVVGDLAGFAAATYNRGLPLLMVPTSLLAMVDSSVGGKTGINHPKGKNLIGAFHQPAGVWIDSACLDTLPNREYLSGLAEVVKYGVIQDAEFFAFIEANTAGILAREADVLIRLIEKCCRLKAEVVEKDEREETGLRAILNYGHTFAHAFETVGGYGAWLHGEAVAAGMVHAARLAEKLGLLGGDLYQRQLKLLETFSLPTTMQSSWPLDDLIAVMKRDKKAVAGRMRFILPTRIGEVRLVDNVAESLVRDVLEGR